MPWSALVYAEAMPARPHGRDGAVEKKLERDFPPLKSHENRVVSNPCIITDKDGRILAWYLPQILTVSRRVSHHFHPHSILTICVARYVGG